MFLVGRHVEIHYLEPRADQVINGQTVLEIGVYLLSVANKSEIEDAIFFRTDYVVLEIEVELVVHGEGSDGCYDINSYL